MCVPNQFRVARNTWAIRAISWQEEPPGPVGAHQMRRLYTFTTMINFRMQERRYGVTEERGRGRSMEPDRNQLTLVTQTSWNGCPSRRASAGRLPLTSNLSRSRTRKRNSTFDKTVCLFIRLELWAQAPLWDQSTPKLSFWYESLRWSTTTSTERIAFARKRLSIGATNRQRSPEIVATVTTG
jgi:hypothetical protein